MDFFEAHENNDSYKSVCTRGSENANLKNSFASLHCPDESLHQWEADSKNYVRKFRRAKQCMQRRITTMKKYNSATPANANARKKHVYPILMAYSYGKNCARKLGTRKNVKRFEESTDRLLDTVAAKQPNVRSVFPTGINATAQVHPELAAILKKPYYSPEQWNAIDRFRTEPENPTFQTEYNSILDANLVEMGAIRSNVGNSSNSSNTDISNNNSKNYGETFKPVRSRKTRKVTKSQTIPQRPNINISQFPAPPTAEELLERNTEIFADITSEWRTYIHASVILDLMKREASRIEQYIALIDNYAPQSLFKSISKQLISNRPKLVNMHKFLIDRIRTISNQRMQLFYKLTQLIEKEGRPIKNIIPSFMFRNKIFAQEEYFNNPEIKAKIYGDLETLSENNIRFDKDTFEINEKIIQTFKLLQDHNEKIEKLKFLIHSRKYKRSNGGLGKQFHEKLDNLEEQTPSLGTEYKNEILNIMKKRMDAFESQKEFIEDLRKAEINPIFLQYVLRFYLLNMDKLNFHKSETYQLKASGIDHLEIPEGKSVEGFVNLIFPPGNKLV